jgi:hypothetical protein
MASRWEERVHAAEQARFEASPIGRLVTALGIPWRWLSLVRLGKRALLVLAWTLVPARLKLFAGGVAAAGLLLVFASITALALVIAQLS